MSLGDIWVWIKDNWLTSIGVFFVLLSACWFLNYVFVHDWLGPQGRVLVLTGIAGIVYLGGVALIRRLPLLGRTLLILGTLGILAALSAGVLIYQLWPPHVPGTAMFVVLAVTSILATRYDLQDLATTVVLGAIAIPSLVGIDPLAEPDNILHYYLIITIFAAGLHIIRGWGGPLLVSCIGAIWAFYLIPVTDPLSFGLTLLAFQVLYAVVPLYRYVKSGEDLNTAAPFTVLISQILMWVWLDLLLDGQLAALLLVWTALLLVVGYFIAKRETSKRMERSQQILRSTMAWVLGYFGVWYASWVAYLLLPVWYRHMAYFAIVLAAVGIARYLYQSPRAARNFALAFVVPLFMMMEPIILLAVPTFYDPSYWIKAVALVTVGLATWILWKDWKPGNSSLVGEWRPPIFLGITVCLSLMVFWNTCDALRSQEIVRTLFLVALTVGGEALLFFAARQDRPAYRYLGLLLIVFVILRLLLKEIWLLSIGVRILIFLAIGVLFILTALFNRKKERK